MITLLSMILLDLYSVHYFFIFEAVAILFLRINTRSFYVMLGSLTEKITVYRSFGLSLSYTVNQFFFLFFWYWIVHVTCMHTILVAVWDLKFIFSVSAVLSTSLLFGLHGVVFLNHVAEARWASLCLILWSLASIVLDISCLCFSAARYDLRHLFFSVLWASISVGIAAFVRANGRIFCNRPRLHKPRCWYSILNALTNTNLFNGFHLAES